MRNIDIFGRILKKQAVVMLDGGLATELENRGHDLSDALWSARLLLDAPDAIQPVYWDYLEAGADVIVSASYQATVPGLVAAGLQLADAEAVLTQSVAQAIAVRDSFWADAANRLGRQRPLVAASVGPYGAYLADGSEYRGDYGLTKAELVAFHLQRWQLLVAAGADVMACETMPSYLEAEALVEVLATTPQQPAWVSFTCRDGQHISDGTPLRQCGELLDGVSQVVAIGINCVEPRFVSSLLSELAAVTDKPLVVYPNSGERWEERSWVGKSGVDVPQFAVQAVEWHNLGARLIGGCCRTTPSHIRQMRAQLLPSDVA